MIRAVVALLLYGCSAAPYCQVERDGQVLVEFDARKPDAYCGVFRFPSFINVQVEKGSSQWKATVSFDDAEALQSAATWVDGGASCVSVPVAAKWAQKEGGFNFTVEGDCGGTPLRAGFSGSL